MKKIIFFASILLMALSCNEKKPVTKMDFDKIAEDYVRLGLNIGMYDSDFVDAYYGPDSLKPPVTGKLDVFPKYIFLNEVKALSQRLAPYTDGNDADDLTIRANWMKGQLKAFSRRIKIFSGERQSFDSESGELFAVVAPVYTEKYFQDLIARLDLMLPGAGTTEEKFQNIAKGFIIPKDKIDTVFKTAIAESRKRTLRYYKLPDTENFKLEYVTGQSWSGYNWYKGNFQSDIQINTDIDIFIERAIDVASHESYPGHHVYNMLLEKNLYRDKGWVEISLYPLFSPQSLIAEGSANYGIELAFPGEEKNKFAENVLLPLAGLDTTGIDLYFNALALKGQLNFVRNEVARGIINKTMTEAEALRWLITYGLYSRDAALKSISFIKKYGSYVINYNYGQQLVKNYIEGVDGKLPIEKRWELFGQLLSSEITPSDLLKKNK